MADLPVNSYDTFTQGQEQNSRDIYNFAANLFDKFNPPPPQITPLNTMGGFQGSGAKTMDELGGLMGGTAPGSFNPSNMRANIMNRETSRGLESNLANEHSAMDENYRTNMGYGEKGLDRMDYLAGVQGKMNELPIDREGQNLATSDTINSMWNKYNNSKPDWFESLLGGVGKAGGTLLGQKLGTKPGLPPLPDMNNPAYVQNFVDNNPLPEFDSGR